MIPSIENRISACKSLSSNLRFPFSWPDVATGAWKPGEQVSKLMIVKASEESRIIRGILCSVSIGTEKGFVRYEQMIPSLNFR
jgi:hypothetical protein